MATLASLLVKLGLDSADYDKGLSEAEKTAATKSKNIGESFSKVGSAMSGAGQTMSLFATAPIMATFTLATDAASDMNETISKSNVVFGEMAVQVQTFASSAATNLGMSQQQALEAAGTFGNLFTSMGTGQDVAAGMSTGLVQMAADLASFNNLDPTEVLEKLRSGMVGETEPLRSLGINITAAAVQTKALELGLMEAGGELSTSAALTARYALIMDQTKNAQGDFARTSDGLANSTRIMKAQMSDAAMTIGQQLLPVALQLTQGISSVITWFTNLSPSTQKVIIIILAVVAAIGPLLMIVGTLISAIGAIIPVVTAVAGVLTFPLIAIIGAVIAIVALLALAWKNNWGGIQEKFAAVKDFLVNGFNAIVKAISGVITWIGNLIDKFKNIKLPSWIIGHSPSPLENSIRGIGDALEDLSSAKLPAFQAELSMAGPGAGAEYYSEGINANFTINSAPGQSEDQIARRVLARMEEARRYARAGGSYAGG